MRDGFQSATGGNGSEHHSIALNHSLDDTFLSYIVAVCRHDRIVGSRVGRGIAVC